MRARGYVLKQDDKDKPLESYLTPIDDIEQRTGLDFFPELDAEYTATRARLMHRHLLTPSAVDA